MGPEDKALFIELKKQLDENTIMLKKILKQNQIALWSKFVYWGFIILLTVGAFALIKPILGTLGDIYTPDNIGDLGTISKIKAEFQGL